MISKYEINYRFLLKISNNVYSIYTGIYSIINIINLHSTSLNDYRKRNVFSN